MPSTDVWRTIYRRFEPEKPAEPVWRADRPDSPIWRLCRALDVELGPRRVYFMGTVGTGKSTELLRLAEARQSKDFVVFLDLVNHFENVVADSPALHRINAWELCFLAAVAIWRAAEEQLNIAWDPDVGRRLMDAWKKVASAAGEGVVEDRASIDLSELAKTMAIQTSAALAGPIGAGLSALVSSTQLSRWNLPLGISKSAPPDQDAALQRLLEVVNDIIMKVQSDCGRKILLVIDGLDRITDLERVKALFIESALFSRLACTLVICGPSLRNDLTAQQIRGFDIKVLPNEPVLNHDHPSDPTKYGSGIGFFRLVYVNRVQDLADAKLADELLDRLAYYSGGQVRMFVKLIRSLAQEVVSDGAEVATMDHVEAALDEQRRLLEMGLTRGHIEVLEQVIDDPAHRVPDDPRVWKLLAGLQLAPYPNESEWYYPHPLLMRSLLRHRQRGSAA